MPIDDLLREIGPAWAWIIAGLVLAAGELLMPGIFLIWLGLAALATGLAAGALPMPWQAQALVFAILTLAFVGAASRLHRRGVASNRHGLNRADRGLIGREAVLAEPIVEGTGRLRFDDTLWRISGPDLAAGARVRVSGIDGTVLCVSPAGPAELPEKAAGPHGAR